MLNYSGNGYLLAGLLALFLGGYSFMNDIKEAKGRRHRKIFRYEFQSVRDLRNTRHARARIGQGDPEYTKFLTKKETGHGHGHGHGEEHGHGDKHEGGHGEHHH
mmetsp:Transcript_47758/g.35010  ORF Transcript_47758/g.35010 Transcript_47758/m.35010 type:complete len:104 (-) Transcript_47758:37-348(-)